MLGLTVLPPGPVNARLRLQAVEGLFREGHIWVVSSLDLYVNRDLLGDDPRYQALLAEAGITW